MNSVKCLLKTDKRCCCNCGLQLETTVCNCFEQWPDSLILERSPANQWHGSIGWACMAFHVADGGPVSIKRDKHGLCEEWQKRKKGKKKLLPRL